MDGKASNKTKIILSSEKKHRCRWRVVTKWANKLGLKKMLMLILEFEGMCSWMTTLKGFLLAELCYKKNCYSSKQPSL